jgi:uncharacterized protein (UPF0264 family)
MTHFLASVRDATEAEAALSAGADVIDLKDPANGALGAVPIRAAREAIAAIAGRAPVSMTIGDLPMSPERVRNAVVERASLGADYVKVGLFPEGDAKACLNRLRPLAKEVRLVMVVFADCPPAFEVVAAAAAMGAVGIMLDTMNKRSGALPDHIDCGALAEFVSRAKAEGLLVGLAGSLRAEHVPSLLALNPDLLGFRGALCRGSRSGSLDREACRTIRSLIPSATSDAADRRPMAAIGVQAL